MSFLKRRWWIALVGCASVAVIVRANEPVTTLPTAPVPGRFTLVVESGGFSRVAHIHVPRGYRPESPPPLVLSFHGAGGNGSHVLDNDGWGALADRAGCLVVAPDGLGAFVRWPTNFRTNPALWNSGQLAAKSPRAAVDDVAYVRQLLDELQTKLPYDARRVFATGHSNGGGMTIRLGVEMSDRLAGLATVAGSLLQADKAPRRVTPALYILGTHDPLMPRAGGEVKFPWGGVLEYPPISESLAVWAQAWGCQSEPIESERNDEVERYEYRAQSSGPSIRVVYLLGHGHQWPGGKAVLPESIMGPIRTKFDATAAIWDFFQQCPPQP